MSLSDVEVRSKARQTFYSIILIALSVPVIMAFSMLVLSSFANQMVTNFDFSKVKFTLRNWQLLFQGRIAITGGLRENIFLYLLNTAVVAFGVAIVTTLVGTLSGYAISRIKFKGRKFILLMMLMLHALPGSILIVGVYFLYRLWMPTNLNALKYFSFFYVIVARAALEIPLCVAHEGLFRSAALGDRMVRVGRRCFEAQDMGEDHDAFDKTRCGGHTDLRFPRWLAGHHLR